MQTVLAIRTSHETVLSIDTATGRLGHTRTADLSTRTVALRLLTGGALGSTCLPFGVDPAQARAILPVPISTGDGILLRLPKGGPDGPLLNLVTSRFIAAVPDGRLESDRSAAGQWELFAFSPRPDGDAPDAIETNQLRSVVTAAFAGAATWRERLQRLLMQPQTDLTRRLIEAVWPLLPLPEFDAFATGLDNGTIRAIAAAYPNDLYAQTTLPIAARLVQTASPYRRANHPVSGSAGSIRPGIPSTPWDPQSSPAAAFRSASAGPEVIGPEFDHLARDGYDGWLSSLPHACNAALRVQTTPNKGVCIVATARSEGVYLLEWIAYYRLLGVDSFFLYTNDNDDGSDVLLAALHRAGVITWTNSRLSPGASAQNKAYGHALNVNTAILDHRWALFIDLDEFLVLNPERFDSLGAFAQWHELRQTDAVGINWVMVSSSGQSRWRPAPLIERNTGLLSEPNAHIKVMLAPRHFIQAHPHFPFADNRRGTVFRLANGARHEYRKQPPGRYHARAFSDDPSSDYACLYHYNFKSVEEFAWKVARNRGDYPLSHQVQFGGLDDVAVGSFVGQHYSTNVVPDRRLTGLVPALCAEIDRLRALPNVAQAEAAVVDQFRRRLAVIKTALSQEPRLDKFGEAGAHMRALIAETVD